MGSVLNAEEKSAEPEQSLLDLRVEVLGEGSDGVGERHLDEGEHAIQALHHAAQ